MTRLDLDQLKDAVRQIIIEYGHSEDDAELILDVLMYAQLRDNNQGLAKLTGAGIPADPHAGKMSVKKSGPIGSLLDAENRHAMVAINRAVDIALERVSDSGVSLVGVRGLNSSSGAIGYYARRIAQTGRIGLVFAGASPLVAPAGSSSRLFGTNPIAIALPSRESIVALDMTTAYMSFFGLVEWRAEGKELPTNVAFNAEGQPTSDPGQALLGAVRTFDLGPRSSGLSFMVQALTGPLVGAAYCGVGDQERNWAGHLVMAIEPELLGDREDFINGVGQMIDLVHLARPIDGEAAVRVPGESGDARAAAYIQAGSIELPDGLFSELQTAHPALRSLAIV